MKIRCRLLCLMVLLLGCLLPAINLMAQDTDEDYKPPRLTVFYHEYSRKSMTLSSDHMEQQIREIRSDEVTTDSELFVKDHTVVLLQLETADFEEERLQILLYKEDYETGRRTEVSEQEYLKGSWRHMGEDIHYLSLNFSEEGHFQLIISYTDSQGQRLQPGDGGLQEACFIDGVYYGPHYTVDLTDPDEEKVTTDSTVCQVLGGMSCFRSAPVYEIVISEENFHPQYVKWSGDSEGISMSAWTSYYEDGIRKNRMTFTVNQEGRYDLSWQCRDGSGRSDSGNRCSFVVDNSMPEVSVSIKEAGLYRYNYDKIRLFSGKAITFVITAEDGSSGVRKISYSYKDKKGKVQEVTQKNNSFNTRFSVEVSLSQNDFSGSLQATAVDFMGIESAVAVSSDVLWESENTALISNKVQISLSDPVFSDSAHHLLYYKNNPKITMTADSSYAGIRESFLGVSFEKSEQEERKDYHLKHEITYNMQQILKLARSDFQRSCRENPIKVYGGFTDNAGYETRKELEEYGLVIDSTAPKVSVEYSEETETGCYKESRTATITVWDINFNPSSVTWNITGDKEGYSIGDWKEKGDKHWCKVDFSRDGSYHLGISVSDYSGNRTIWEDKKSFSIDKTVPKVILWMNQSDLKHERYYNTSKTVYLFVSDENISKDGVHLYNGRTKYYLGNTSHENSREILIQEDNIGNISGNIPHFLRTSRWQVFSAVISKEGTYRLSGNCEDLAGNRSAVVKTEPFIIDLTKPEFVLSHLEEGIVYTSEVDPDICIKDRYLQKNETEVSLYYEDRTRAISLEKNFYKEESKVGKNNMIYHCKDFSREKKQDNHYILKISACDQAGNKNTQEIHFSVDRFGTRYVIDPETKKVLEKYYLRESPEIAVTAYSLYSQDTEVILSYNNEEFRTLEASEYETDTVILHGTEQLSSEEVLPEKYKGWHRTTYRILKDVLKEEGDYQITIRSREKATAIDGTNLTESENTLWTEALHIAIDRTPPSVHIGGFEEKTYDADSKEYTVSAMDNTRLKKVKIYVRKSGAQTMSSYTLYTEKDFNEEHSITAKLGAYAGYQFIGYEAWDYAGNHVSSTDRGDEQKVLVTPSSTVRAYCRHPYKICLFILLPMGLIVLVIILTRKHFFDIFKMIRR